MEEIQGSNTLLCQTIFHISSLQYVSSVMLTYSGDTVQQIRLSILNLGSDAQEETIAIIKKRLTSHLNVLKDALLDAAKPTISKSDLQIWREIFTLYESSSIICPTNECTCLVDKLDNIPSRYSTFWATIETRHFVDSVPSFWFAD